jgi:hypothetical protein
MILLRSKLCGIRWISLLSSIRCINELSLSVHKVCVIVISYRTEHASFFDPCMPCTQSPRSCKLPRIGALSGVQVT